MKRKLDKECEIENEDNIIKKAKLSQPTGDYSSTYSNIRACSAFLSTKSSNIYEQLELHRIGQLCGARAGGGFGKNNNNNNANLTLSSSDCFDFEVKCMSYLSYYPLSLNTTRLNKIFASSWWDENELLFGTKGNHLCRMNVNETSISYIPTLDGTVPYDHHHHSSGSSDDLTSSASGIHCIVPSPNLHFLASGGSNVSSIGIYSLPNYKPYCILENVHKNWLFDVCWADDEHLFSCGRDGIVAAWNIYSNENQSSSSSSSNNNNNNSLLYKSIQKPLEQIQAASEDDNQQHGTIKLRSMDRILGTNSVIVTSMDKSIYEFDIHSMKQTWKIYKNITKLTDSSFSSTFIKSHPHRPFVFALGFHKGFSIEDFRIKTSPNSTIQSLTSRGNHSLSAVRTLDFYDNLFTYGTAIGSVYIMDLRNQSYIETHHTPILPNLSGLIEGELNFSCLIQNDAVRATTTTTTTDSRHTNTINNNNTFRDLEYIYRHYSAVYTHSIAPDGFRIFCGGGPIPISRQGSTACIWQ